jgi:hypothetical protein
MSVDIASLRKQLTGVDAVGSVTPEPAAFDRSLARGRVIRTARTSDAYKGMMAQGLYKWGRKVETDRRCAGARPQA